MPSGGSLTPLMSCWEGMWATIRSDIWFGEGLPPSRIFRKRLQYSA